MPREWWSLSCNLILYVVYTLTQHEHFTSSSVYKYSTTSLFQCVPYPNSIAHSPTPTMLVPYPNNIAHSPTPTMLVLFPEYHSSIYDFN